MEFTATPTPVLGTEAIRESIKTLRTNIEFAGMDKAIKSVLLTSAVPSEGKSTIALNLALAMADIGKTTLLIENDFRKPVLAKMLKLRASYGIVDVLNGTQTLDEVIQDTGYPNLSFLGVGGVIGNPVEILASQRYAAIIDSIQTVYDFSIFDAPPIGSIIDGALIAPKVDGTLIVIRAGYVDAPTVKNVVTQLEKAGARILGAVLNSVDRTRVNSSYYGYYGYEYGENAGNRKKKRR